VPLLISRLNLIRFCFPFPCPCCISCGITRDSRQPDMSRVCNDFSECLQLCDLLSVCAKRSLLGSLLAKRRAFDFFHQACRLILAIGDSAHFSFSLALYTRSVAFGPLVSLPLSPSRTFLPRLFPETFAIAATLETFTRP